MRRRRSFAPLDSSLNLYVALQGAAIAP